MYVRRQAVTINLQSSMARAYNKRLRWSDTYISHSSTTSQAVTMKFQCSMRRVYNNTLLLSDMYSSHTLAARQVRSMNYDVVGKYNNKHILVLWSEREFGLERDGAELRNTQIKFLQLYIRHVFFKGASNRH